MYIYHSIAFIYYLNLQYIDSRRSIKCETKEKVKKNKKSARALALAFAFENTSWQAKRNRLCCLANPMLPCLLPSLWHPHPTLPQAPPGRATWHSKHLPIDRILTEAISLFGRRATPRRLCMLLVP